MIGLAWLLLDKVGILLLSTLSTFWYAKLLGPEGFGQAAVILAVYQILAQAFGTVQQSPLVALKDNLQKGYNVSATSWLCISFITSLITLVLFWQLWGLEFVYYALLPCSALMLVSLSKVYLADLLRNQNFKSLAYRQSLSRFVSVIVGLTLAYLKFPMWAVIAQWSLEPFISYLILRRQSPIRIQLSYDNALFKSLLKQGAPLLIKSVSQEMKGKGLIVLLGVLVSETASAYYSLAIKFVELVRSFFSYSFASFSLPRFVEVRDDLGVLAKRYESLSLLLVTVMVPVCFGLASLSTAIVSIFFSPEWAPVAGLIYWLCIIEAVISVTALVHVLQVATFNTKNTVLVDLASLVVVPLVVWLTSSSLGLQSAIIACTVHALLLFPFYSLSLYRVVRPKILVLYSSMFFILLSGFFMIEMLARLEWSDNFHDVSLMIIMGGFCYLLAYGVFVVLKLINFRLLKREIYL